MMRTGAVMIAAAMIGPLFAQEPPAPPAPPAAPRAPRTPREMNRQIVISPRSGSYLGIGVADVDAERAKALKLPEERGVEVKNVNEDSPAAKAGIKEGDVVLEYNGQRIEGQEQLTRMVRETPPGRQVRLQIWRNGAAQTVTVTVARRTGRTVFAGRDGEEFSFEMPEIPRIAPIPVIPDLPRSMMSWRSTTLGIESESLNSQLASYFGVKEGVLVRSVVKGSAAEKAGIKAGDVIMKVDATTVTSPREITSVLRSIRGTKRTVPVVLMRDRKEMTLTVTIEDPGADARPVRAVMTMYEGC